MNPAAASFISVFLISLLSLIGLFALSLKKKFLQKIIFFLVAFAAGSLLGDSFFHLLPHSSQEFTSSLALGGSVLSGFLLFFILEKFLKWRHCHDIDCQEHHRELGIMNLFADGLHNFFDGIIIAGSFLTSPSVGLATTLAVGFHEIPQEIGDFAVLIHSGFSRKRALGLNFISALTAALGAGLTLSLNQLTQPTPFLIPATAGGFIYIAASGLIPQLHREIDLKKSLLQFLGLILGMGIMALLLFLE